MAKGYAVVLLDVTGPSLSAENAQTASAIEARHGGRPIIVDNAEEVVVGE
ncbi:MAG: hypothetical protein ACXWH0_11915 [Acidimicrobiia bacterium]